ncbi:MAG: methionine synthase [Bryobacterales bacterium]|nr:methionine synthase [Bryobacterales bacterium]MDE0621614.1 methionine synthase [Bryobacterales bacterium]
MQSRFDRIGQLNECLAERILVLDGAMGTQLQEAKLTAEDFGGTALEGCNENLVLTRPDVVRKIHSDYCDAGADIIETNTFGAMDIVLAEYGLQDEVARINAEAGRLAREAADACSTRGKPRFVAGAMGPSTKSITVTGGVTFAELVSAYRDQSFALAEYVDLLILETCQDTRNVKAALIGIGQALRKYGLRIPVIVSGTIEPMGSMLAGQSAEALVVSLEYAEPLGVGLNCATGPEYMTDHIRTIHETATPLVSCYPNAGLPDEDGLYGETPDSLASTLERFTRNGWLNIVGGCCGTTPAHIRSIAQMAQGHAPRRHRPTRSTKFTGIDVVEACEDNRPLLVGERTNIVGSRRFKRLISEERFEQASEIARAQVRGGAQIIDVNLENPDRDELSDIDSFYGLLIKKIKAPIMIDSTNPAAVERALTYCQGKAVVNSINFENGEERFDQVVPLLRRYGAAVVVGTIDEDPEQAQAITRERKLAIVERAHRLLTGKWQLAEEDLVFDPLVFPCGTGDANYIGSAVETIESLRLIKSKLPSVKTLLGVSNVSFGLPPAAREVVNAVFLHHATKAGLDLAIVNTEKLRRFASITPDELQLADGLLRNLPCDGVDAPEDYRLQTAEQKAALNQLHIARVTEHFRGAVQDRGPKVQDLPLDERLARYIVEGTKEGLFPDLDQKLADSVPPLEIVNGPLMDGMKRVGRLFNDNELIVAEVLQSAEAMKAAVDHLEPHMEKTADANKGKVVLATVKGDVHDIGKNLVDIILSNNGYTVLNLGIKVPPEELIKACREHRPDAIGLSGLLVKSAQQMVVTAQDLRSAGVCIPLLVGGAALSANFTRKRIAPSYGELTCYAQDAMSGLALLDRALDPAAKAALEAEHAPVRDDATRDQRETASAKAVRSSRVRRDVPPLKCPYDARRREDIPHLRELWQYINPAMLYSRHLGFKGNFKQALADRDEKALALHTAVEDTKAEAERYMKARAIWRFLDAQSHGNSIRLFEPGGDVLLHEFSFPRQRRADGLSLADFIARPNGYRDSVALFCVTAGEGIRDRSETYRDRGEYFRSHAIQALAIETAEACAEWVHRRIREDWGFADPAEMTMEDRFRSKYRGRRYSFGYPACPNLEDQRGLFKLLDPSEIGVTLTDGDMMDPEASVSAVVFQHPDCIYFDVKS